MLRFARNDGPISSGGLWPAAAAAIGGSALVGLMPLSARLLYGEGVGAPSMLFWRFGVALIALFVLARWRRLDLRQAWRAGAWRLVLLAATLGAAQTLCFWESIKTLDTSVAELLFYTYPAITLVLDRAVFKAPIRPLAVLCIAAIVLGAALITAPGLKGGAIDPRGLAWALPAPLIYSVYLAINARLLQRHPPVIGAGSLFSGMLLTFGLMAAARGLDIPASWEAWLLVLFIGLGPGALWMMLFTYSVPRLGASSFAILANTEVVTVVAIGILVLGEPVTPGRALGAALILAGIVTRALARKAPHPSPLPARGERENSAADVAARPLSPLAGRGTG